MPQTLTKPQQNILLTLAWQSIAHGLKNDTPLSINTSDYPAAFAKPCATFVKLTYKHKDYGCVGTLHAVRPLLEDICENAFNAAFSDIHSPVVTEKQLDDIEIHIDLVSPLEPLIFNSEMALAGQLRPNIDGLILEDGSHHASFLPTNWESLHTPIQFLQHLKQKAGLPITYWSKTIQATRFTTQRLA